MAKPWDDCVRDADVATIQCLEPLFENIVSAVASFAGIALFLMLIIGGYNFLFAGGDPKKVEKAKGTITGAVIGLVVMVAAYLIILLIGEFTGTKDIITTFKIINPP